MLNYLWFRALFLRVDEFVLHGFDHLYFSHQVQWKRKQGSYSAIHLLDESEMSRRREVWLNLMIFMVKCTCVRGYLLFLLRAVLILEAGGKPSTWFPPGELVEPPLHTNFQDTRWKWIFWKKRNFQKILKIVKITKFAKISRALDISLSSSKWIAE